MNDYYLNSGTLSEFVDNAYNGEFPSFYRLNHDLEKYEEEPLTRNEYLWQFAIAVRGEPKVGEYDCIVKEDGNNIYIKNASAYSITPNSVYIEYEDFHGNRGVYNSYKDEGTLELREEGVINACEKLDTRMFHKALMSFFARNKKIEHYTPTKFDADIHDPKNLGVVKIGHVEEYGVDICADVYDCTIFVKVPKDMQVDSDRIVLEEYPTLNRMGYGLRSKDINYYEGLAAELLEERETLLNSELELA